MSLHCVLKPKTHKEMHEHHVNHILIFRSFLPDRFWQLSIQLRWFALEMIVVLKRWACIASCWRLLKHVDIAMCTYIYIYILQLYVYIYILCNVIHVCVLCIWHVCINMHMHSHIYIYIHMMIQYKLIIIYRIYRLRPKKSPCGSASADVEHSDVPLQV